jgi:hypothetical protein
VSQGHYSPGKPALIFTDCRLGEEERVRPRSVEEEERRRQGDGESQLENGLCDLLDDNINRCSRYFTGIDTVLASGYYRDVYHKRDQMTASVPGQSRRKQCSAAGCRNRAGTTAALRRLAPTLHHPVRRARAVNDRQRCSWPVGPLRQSPCYPCHKSCPRLNIPSPRRRKAAGQPAGFGPGSL